MMSGDDLSRFAINQITTPKWSMPQAIEGYAAQGISGIAVWRNFLDDYGVEATARHLSDAGMWVASLCTSAWVNETDPARLRAAIDTNKRILDQAAAIGAPCVVMVVGGLPVGDKDPGPREPASTIHWSSSRPMLGRSESSSDWSRCIRCIAAIAAR